MSERKLRITDVINETSLSCNTETYSEQEVSP